MLSGNTLRYSIDCVEQLGKYFRFFHRPFFFFLHEGVVLRKTAGNFVYCDEFHAIYYQETQINLNRDDHNRIDLHVFCAFNSV